MTQEIKASYKWTVGELIGAREAHDRAQCRPFFRVILIFLSCLAILVGWCAFNTRGWSVPAVLLPLVGIYFLFLRKYDVRWAVRRHFNKRPDRNTNVTCILAEYGLHITTDGGEGKQSWAMILKVRKGTKGFLIYPNDRIYYWLPYIAFSSTDERGRAEVLLRNKIKDFKKIR